MTPMEREMAKCSYDVFYFARRYIWTFDEENIKIPWQKFPDPDNPPEAIPEWLLKRWHMWDYLDHVFTKILEPKPMYWLKSQRMMITICFCITLLQQFLFADGMNAFVTSKPGGVDGGAKGAWKSTFGKVRMMFDKLPAEMIEYACGRHYRATDLFNYMAAENPQKGNMIMGDAPTINAGVGEGYTFAFVDEASSIYFMNVIHTNLTQSCKTNKNYVAFPRGRSNKFADVHFAENHYGFEKVDIDWRMNPRYTREWYNVLSETMTKFEIAQRVDRSFEESTKGKVWKKFINPVNVKPTEFIEGLPIYLWWDFGFKDATSVGFIQFERPSIRVFDWYEVNRSNYRDNSQDLRAMLEKYGIEFHKKDEVDSEGHDTYRMLGDLRSVGDPQVTHGEISSGENLQGKYSEQGFDIEGCDSHNSVMILDKIDDEFERGNIEIDPGCEPFIDTCQYWAWQEDSRGNPKPGATQPAHSKHSHAGKAFEYGFVMLTRATETGLSDWIKGQESMRTKTPDIYKSENF